MKSSKIGYIIVVVCSFLLLTSSLISVYEFKLDEVEEDINSEGVLVLSIIFFLTALLSGVFTIMNKFNAKNKFIFLTLIMFFLFSIIEFIRMISFM